MINPSKYANRREVHVILLAAALIGLLEPSPLRAATGGTPSEEADCVAAKACQAERTPLDRIYLVTEDCLRNPNGTMSGSFSNCIYERGENYDKAAKAAAAASPASPQGCQAALKDCETALPRRRMLNQAYSLCMETTEMAEAFEGCFYSNAKTLVDPNAALPSPYKITAESCYRFGTEWMVIRIGESDRVSCYLKAIKQYHPSAPDLLAAAEACKGDFWKRRSTCIEALLLDRAKLGYIETQTRAVVGDKAASKPVGEATTSGSAPLGQSGQSQTATGAK